VVFLPVLATLALRRLVLTVLGLEARAGAATAVLSGARHGRLKVRRGNVFSSLDSAIMLTWFEAEYQYDLIHPMEMQ
jgi:hypothetical protein